MRLRLTSIQVTKDWQLLERLISAHSTRVQLAHAWLFLPDVVRVMLGYHGLQNVLGDHVIGRRRGEKVASIVGACLVLRRPG